ncbi:MAG: carboxylating nicotinate-nucleotide diphosphorylase [Gemmatimonadales bacterium]
MADAQGQDAVRRALDEDHARADVTVGLLGSAATRVVRGVFMAEAPCAVAGVAVAAEVFRQLDPRVVWTTLIADGSRAEPGDRIAEIKGPAGTLLSGERTALNFLQHLSGIATATRRAVDAVAGTGATITHTRKTAPGLRDLQVAAVVAGGGVPNRTSLAHTVYWKDNHWALLGEDARLAAMLAQVPRGTDVWVEVETDEQFAEALAAGVRHMLADNQTPERVAEWIQRSGGQVRVQASGGITAETAGAYARAGAHLISIGGLTHSVTAVPITFALCTGS